MILDEFLEIAKKIIIKHY